MHKQGKEGHMRKTALFGRLLITPRSGCRIKSYSQSQTFDARSKVGVLTCKASFSEMVWRALAATVLVSCLRLCSSWRRALTRSSAPSCCSISTPLCCWASNSCDLHLAETGQRRGVLPSALKHSCCPCLQHSSIHAVKSCIEQVQFWLIGARH